MKCGLFALAPGIRWYSALNKRLKLRRVAIHRDVEDRAFRIGHIWLFARRAFARKVNEVLKRPLLRFGEITI